MRGFVFCVLYIIMFGTLLSSIPVGLQGQGDTVETIVPVDPSLVTGFSDIENFTGAAFSGNTYEYSLNSRKWLSAKDANEIGLAAKKLIAGVLWLGGLDICDFISPSGANRGVGLAWTEITADAEEGAVRYTLQFDNGNAAGYFVVYWNTTTYATATLAMASNELYFIHGIGFDTSATSNIGALLVSVLLLQIPDVPTLISVMLAAPTWVAILYVLWFIIKEMIPFV
jgi:hypothetical protein